MKSHEELPIIRIPSISACKTDGPITGILHNEQMQGTTYHDHRIEEQKGDVPLSSKLYDTQLAPAMCCLHGLLTNIVSAYGLEYNVHV